ncbi:AraC family transcriptional regulator, partial [Caproiciproducens sp. CPB-2]
MKIYDQAGILEASDLYFHTHSTQAEEMYFYPVCTGHYFCDNTYVVDRQSYNSFLIIYVKQGTGFVEQNGRHIPLHEGSLAFIDCYKPHLYYTKSDWEIYWVHFDGILARQYFNTATRNGIIFTPQNPYNAEHCICKIFERYHGHMKVNEVVISKIITDLLTELILCANKIVSKDNNGVVIEEIMTYISENADQPLTLELLAKRASLSPYYFTRVFKKETGFTPHEYLIRVRVELAKFLLTTTDVRIKEIAYRSGFDNECSFCTSFKKATGTTPLKYRGRTAKIPKNSRPAENWCAPRQE